MATLPGTNLTDIRIRNRALVLRLVATNRQVSRVDIARTTGLTKTTASKIVYDLIAEGIICESNPELTESALGRPPIALAIGPSSPCVVGLLIKRNICTAIIADYSAQVIRREDHRYEGSLTRDGLIEILCGLFDKVMSGNKRTIVAIGISCIGPVNTVSKRIINPPNFYDIEDFPICEIMTQRTGIEAHIIHDANGGALAEKIYGSAKSAANFLYLHIMNGIGAGCILNNKVFNGDLGQSGEIGHTSINFAGPVCDCGNAGCLEMYANMENINKRIRHMRDIYPLQSPLTEERNYDWSEVIRAAAKRDYYAVAALDEFCEYLSYALANTINMLDINRIVVGYDSAPDHDTIETILSKKLNAGGLTAKTRKVSVTKSAFGGDAPLIGSVALITNRFFSGELEF